MDISNGIQFEKGSVMKKLIKNVLADVCTTSQPNLESDACRETIATLIIAAIKSRPWFLELSTLDGKPKLTEEEQRYKDHWTCDICGKDTSGIDYDYIGSGTNHLGCELEAETTK